MTPGLYSFCAVLILPRLENGVVTALSLNHFTRMWVLVRLNFARLASANRLHYRAQTAAGLRVENVDDISQTETVFAQESTQLAFKLHLLFEAVVFL